MGKWHKNPNEISCLINLMNSEGYVLEDRIIILLNKHYGQDKLNSKQVFERCSKEGVERIEIDAWVENPISYFVFEVKSSVYDWIFLNGPYTNQHFHMHLYNSSGLQIIARLQDNQHPTNSFISESVFKVVADQSGEKLLIQTNKPVHKGLKIPERPSGREIVRPAAKQVLKNLVRP